MHTIRRVETTAHKDKNAGDWLTTNNQISFDNKLHFFDTIPRQMHDDYYVIFLY